jgi:uncharacterized membrane protein YhaH (DUF805 family)
MSIGGVSIWQLLIILIMFSVTLLPGLMALFSKKSHGTDKAVWFLLSFIFSWLGYLPYYYLVVKKKSVHEPI